MLRFRRLEAVTADGDSVSEHGLHLGDDHAWRVTEPRPQDGHAVWCIPLELDAARRATCTRLLDDRERDRADRFLRPQDRDRFLASHAALRIILGAALGVAPRSLDFAVSPTGRPGLARPDAGRLDFNLSHSGALALVGVSTTTRIGVDLEAHRPLPDALRIARAHFHPREVAALEAAGKLEEAAGRLEEAVGKLQESAGKLREAAGPRQEAAFFAAWTAKEAFVKAVGAGLSMPLAAFAVSLPPAPPALLEAAGTAVDAWTLIRLAPGPGTTGAVAIEAPCAACQRARLPPDWVDRTIA